MSTGPGHRPTEPEPGVTGEDPNRFDPDGIGPLDEAPDGQTPSDPDDTSSDSLPPGA